MITLDEFFEIKVDKEKMKATIVQKKRLEEDDRVTVEDLTIFIKEHGITFGIIEENVAHVVNETSNLPLVIAEGKKAVNGENAFLVPVFPDQENIDKDELQYVDLKQVIFIPSVTPGQLIGKKSPATPGTPGLNVFGEELPPKPGKDFILRKGKNTRINEEQTELYSVIDGQMSVETKVIHVYPTFEINGDLDLKYGNISFIGSVNIRGNVPSGFEINAKGDIRISGNVESATLISEGSIYVGAGVVGQGRGLIKAKGEFHTSYINQGNVDVSGDIHVAQSILHSQIQTEGSIYCYKGKGNIVGGHVSAAKEIIVNEVGNSHNTRTSLYVGVSHSLLQKQKLNGEKAKKSEEDLVKLKILLSSLNEKEKRGPLTANEKIMRLRIRHTMNITEETLLEAKEILEDLKEKFALEGNGCITVNKAIFPNVDVRFGKYRRKIISPYQSVKIFIENSEIAVVTR